MWPAVATTIASVLWLVLMSTCHQQDHLSREPPLTTHLDGLNWYGESTRMVDGPFCLESRYNRAGQEGPPTRFTGPPSTAEVIRPMAAADSHTDIKTLFRAFIMAAQPCGLSDYRLLPHS